MKHFGARLVESVLGILAPRACAACGEPVNAVFCAACGAPPSATENSIDGVPVLAGGGYAPPLSTAIRRFKFEGHPELAEPLASLVVGAVRGLELEREDAWVPVPLHRARLVERGFNQAALVARALATRAGGVVLPLLLERQRDTEQQARLGRAARSENASGAFALRRPSSRRRVILVDDVVTTGATARACLSALREGGIEVLAVVALAHASG